MRQPIGIRCGGAKTGIAKITKISRNKPSCARMKNVGGLGGSSRGAEVCTIQNGEQKNEVVRKGNGGSEEPSIKGDTLVSQLARGKKVNDENLQGRVANQKHNEEEKSGDANRPLRGCSGEDTWTDIRTRNQVTKVTTRRKNFKLPSKGRAARKLRTKGGDAQMDQSLFNHKKWRRVEELEQAG